jgi:hypothetical protein
LLLFSGRVGMAHSPQKSEPILFDPVASMLMTARRVNCQQADAPR